METIRVTCPACGEEMAGEVYESVNVTLEPEKKLGILDGSLFSCTCPVCGTTVRLSYPLLYHDMKQRVMIRFGAEDDELDEMTGDSGLFDGAGYTLRRVETYEDLLEKIRTFDMELDDRVVELCKQVLLVELAEEEPELKVKRVLLDPKGETVYVAFIDEDEDVFAIELPDDLYNRIYDLFAETAEDMTPDGFAVIDEAWARETLSYAQAEDEF